MTEAEAAEQRLRAWMRKSGRGVPGDRPSHQYGAVPSDDYEHGAYVDLDEGKESSWAVVLVRRCRRLCCNVLGLLAAVLAGAVLTLVFLSTTKDDIAFVALGDWGCGVTNCAVPPTAPIGYQNGGMNTRKVAAAMAAAATAISSKFVLALGDNFYFRGVKNADDPLFKEVWEDQFSAPSLQVPWYVILGNHDHYGNPEAQIDFARQHEDCIKFGHCSADGKGRWTMPRYWYQQHVQSKTFTANFVFIDTVILCQGASEDLVREKQRLGALKPADMRRWEEWAGQRRMMARLQLQWLEATLNASTADWLIVAGHYPVFSGGEHGDTPELQRTVLPLLEKYGVDVYLCGHDHTLQHLKRQNVNYFVSGSGSFNGLFKEQPESLFGSIENGFTAHRLTRHHMDVSVINLDGRTLYRARVKRREKRHEGLRLMADGVLGRMEGEVETGARNVEKMVH